MKVVLTGERFILTPAGIHFQGELQLATVKGGRKKEPLSVLLPQEVPAGSVLVGEAKLQAWKVVEPGKALLAGQTWLALAPRENIPGIIGPGGAGGEFFSLASFAPGNPDLERPNPG